jgi:hypothetical protein
MPAKVAIFALFLVASGTAASDKARLKIRAQLLKVALSPSATPGN